MSRTFALLGAVAATGVLIGAALLHRGYGRRLRHPMRLAVTGPRTHADVVSDLAPSYRPRLTADVARAGTAYPPSRLRLVGLKEEKVLEVWVATAQGWRRLRSYPVLAASGGPGPKLREGDRQVPEGLYRLTTFNPNSSYHLSVRVDYPNDDDRRAAQAEGRSRLGGDIYIHGRAVSIGCLAIGDEAIEELYVLLADTGLRRVTVLLAPSGEPRAAEGAPAWVRALYERLDRELRATRGA